MNAIEFTPAGPQEIVDKPAAASTISASAAIAAMRANVDAQEALREQPRPAQARATAALTRRTLVQEIRSRLRELNAEIKRLRRLEREAAELKRLLAAAKAPPAAVTHITQARKSG